MKIIHLDTDDIGNSLSGGQPVRTYNINRYLVSNGHHTEVITAPFKGCMRSVEVSGINYSRLGFSFPLFGLSSHLSYLLSLGPFIKNRRADLIVEEFMPPVGFCFSPMWTNVPVVLMVQWYFFEAWEKRYHLPFESWMLKIARKGMYKYVIVQTEAMKNKFSDMLPDALIKTIPCGIDDSAFGDLSTIPGKYALFLGRLDDYQKGITWLLESWKKSCSSIPLYIVGDGKDRLRLKKNVSDFKLQECVTFTGRITGKQKSEMIRNSRLVVIPSREETFGIVALEAMAAGKPVVCFDIEHLNEVVSKQWGVLVKPYNTTLFAQAVSSLWNNINLCLQLGSAGQKAAHNYRWCEIARQQESFYLEVLNRNKT